NSLSPICGGHIDRRAQGIVQDMLPGLSIQCRLEGVSPAGRRFNSVPAGQRFDQEISPPQSRLCPWSGRCPLTPFMLGAGAGPSLSCATFIPRLLSSPRIISVGTLLTELCCKARDEA